MTDYDNLINLMDNVSIKFDKNDYIVDNDIDIDFKNLNPIENVTLNFCQLWSLFSTIPLVQPFTHELKRYYWTIHGKNESIIFSIVGYSSNFLQNEDWIIMTNSKDPMEKRAFVSHLLDAIDCYNKYYRAILENDSMDLDDENDDDDAIDAYKIKREITQMIKILQNL